ncbi:hypothetical protein [uncultured Vibrio sp.]|uniref:hypothetical protein n=1 Tax=uncultured Vibrio sp. TaxID=114054 RepID=UPI00261178D2|nr:hypothetical protein [uncultured Vibrio sp.]
MPKAEMAKDDKFWHSSARHENPWIRDPKPSLYVPVFYIGLNQEQAAHSEIAPNTWLLDFEQNIDDSKLAFKGVERG